MSKLSHSLETLSLSDGDCPCQQKLRLKEKEIQDLQADIERMRQELNTIKMEKELERDEVCALKAETRSYRAELEASGLRAEGMEKIGKEVRVRFLENHRQRMGKRIGPA